MLKLKKRKEYLGHKLVNPPNFIEKILKIKHKNKIYKQAKKFINMQDKINEARTEAIEAKIMLTKERQKLNNIG